MLETLETARGLTLLVLGVAALALELFALVDSQRYPQQAYASAGKLTKTWWTVILGVAAAVGFVTLDRVLGIGLMGVVAAAVYMVDVRPAVRSMTPRKNRGGRNKGGSGPYGAW